MISASIIVLALTVDTIFGDPRRWHPLAGFGKIANWIEFHFNRFNTKTVSRLLGTLAVLICVAPFTILLFLFQQQLSEQPFYFVFYTVIVLYFAIGAKSLLQHAEQVYNALENHDINDARIKTGYLVSRNTQQLDENELSAATIESVLENGNDAIFAALFWFLIAGLPGVVLYRLCNTLDAMWGYRTKRFEHFGWFAAKLDDLLNFVPARLTALSYAVCGRFKTALRCWFTQAPHWQSPNAGPVMASGAGALSIALGGAAMYHGQIQQRHILGDGIAPTRQDIQRAKQLLQRCLLLWLVLIIMGDYFV